MATESIKAIVVSGDIVGSSLLKAAARKKLQQRLDSFFEMAQEKWPDLYVQQYRGDSIQGYLLVYRPVALRFTLMLHSYLLRDEFKMRLSVGVGKLTFKSNTVITSDGTAFHISGTRLDAITKTGDLISIAGTNEDFTREWQVHSASLNFIIERWTPQQAEAIYLQLQGERQQTIARELKITQPSVHQRLQGAGWPVVQKILHRFESVIPMV